MSSVEGEGVGGLLGHKVCRPRFEVCFLGRFLFRFARWFCFQRLVLLSVRELLVSQYHLINANREPSLCLALRVCERNLLLARSLILWLVR